MLACVDMVRVCVMEFDLADPMGKCDEEQTSHQLWRSHLWQDLHAVYVHLRHTFVIHELTSMLLLCLGCSGALDCMCTSLDQSALSRRVMDCCRFSTLDICFGVVCGAHVVAMA